MSEIRTPGWCALCKSRCGSIMVTRDGRLVAQEPDPAHPTGKALCIKGRAAPEIVYNPQRQLFPLVRTRPKGERDPGWRRVSWDEALDRVAEQLDRIRRESGPEAVAFGWTTPSGTPISDDLRWVERFTNAFGSPNVAYGVEVCNWHKDYAHAYTFGRGIASPDFEKTNCIVFWGHNPSATWLDHATAAAAARARGAALIVVDPRRAGFAAKADLWLRVRPGSDGALALGIAGEMIRNGWFDRDFMRDWSNGPLLVRQDTDRFLRAAEIGLSADPDSLLAWDEAKGAAVPYSPSARAYPEGASPALRASVDLVGTDGRTIPCRSAFSLYEALCATYPPERVEALSWVPAADVTAAAKLIWESGPVCYYGWSGLGQHTNATQTDRAIALVMALTGSFDAPGGNVQFARPAAKDVSGAEFMSAAQRAKCIDLGRSRLGPGRHGWTGSDALYDAILHGRPYPIRGLFGFGRNFLVNHADGQRGAEALTALAFHVQTDVVMTPTASLADVFLPINTPWERQALRVGFEGSQAAENLVQLRQVAVEPQGESRSEAFVTFELAKRLGFGERFWDGDVEAGFREILAPLQITPDDLRARPGGIAVPAETAYRTYVDTGFKTATGKVEVFSETFRDEGHDPLPGFVEPALSPHRDTHREFPLVLTSAKFVQFCHSQHRHVPSLRRRSKEPEVSLHPDTAAERGIEAGDWVEIATPNGRARMRAKLDGALDRRVVSGQYGWWQGNEALGLPGYDAFADTGSNFNRLISDRFSDPISGSTGLRSSLCELRVLAGGSRAWTGWRAFEIENRVLEARDILSFRLRPLDGAPLPTFFGGQHVTLKAERADGGGTLVRCYSLSGRPDGGAYRISVKLEPQSADRAGMSALLHARDSGSAIWLQAPKGGFRLFDGNGPAPVVMVAGGIGITPILSMLHEIRAVRPSTAVRLLYSVRSADDHAFSDELAALNADLPGLSVTTFHSRHLREGSELAGVVAGRITPEHLQADAERGAVFYLCGPPGFIGALSAALAGMGVPPERIRFEAFGPSSKPRSGADLPPQPVTLARSGATLTWHREAGSLLDLLESAGVSVSSGCRTGQCETCAVALVAGEVGYTDDVEIAADEICLTCVGTPMTPITLDL